MSTPQTALPRRKRRYLIALLLIVVAPALLLAAAVLLLLNTQSGRDLLVAQTEKLVTATTPYELELGALSGRPPQHLRLERFALSDTDGALFSGSDLVLRWELLALLDRRLDIVQLSAERIEVTRLPQGAPGDDEPGAPLTLPSSLPLSISLAQFSIAELDLDEALIGAAARLSVAASATAERRGRLDGTIDLRRIDAQPGEIAAHFVYDLTSGELAAEMRAAEPEDGLIAALLDLPGRPPVRLDLEGSGTLAHWQGRISAMAGDVAGFSADIDLRGPLPLSLQATGNARVAALLPPDLQALAEPAIDFDLRARRDGEGRLRIEPSRLASGALEARLAGETDAGFEEVDARLDLTLAQSQGLEALLGPVSFAGAALTAQAQGPLMRPAIDLHLGIDALQVPEAGASRLDVSLALAPDRALADPDMILAIDGMAIAEQPRLLSPAVTEAVGPQLQLDLRGQLNVSDLRSEIEHLAVLAGPLSLEASGRLALADNEGALSLQLRHEDLAGLAPLAGIPLGGRLDAEGRLDLPGAGALSLQLDAGLDDPVLAQPAAADLWGDRLELAARLDYAPTTGAVLRDLALTGAGFRLRGTAEVDSRFTRIDGRSSLDLPDLSLAEALAGTAIEGSLTAEAVIAGTIADPDIDLRVGAARLASSGVELTDIDARLTLTRIVTRPDGDFAVAAGTPYGQLELRSALTLEERTLVLRDLRLEQADGARLAGGLVVPLDGRPASGRLTGEVPRLAALASRFDQAIAGRLSFDVVLRDEDARQVVAMEATVRSLAVAGSEIEEARLSLSLDDPLSGDPAVTADLRAGTIFVAGGRLDTLRLQGAGRAADLNLVLSAAGDFDGPAGIEAQGKLSRGNGLTEITVASLAARFADQEVSLNQPARLRLEDGTTRIDDVDLAFADGRFRLSGLLAPAALRLEFDAEALSLAHARRFVPHDIDGRLDARARIAGTPAQPQGTFNLAIDQGRLRADAPLEAYPPLDVAIDGTLGGGRVQLSGTVAGATVTPFQVNLDAPLAVSAQPVGLTLDETAALSGNLAWQGRLGEIMALMPIDTLRLDGDGRIDLRLAGTFAQPQLFGEVAISNGLYENFVSGTLLDPMDLLLTARGDTIEVTRLTALDGSDGEIALDGRVRLLDGMRLDADLRADIRNARLMRRDDVMAQLSGRLALQGILPEEALVSGRIRNDLIEIRLIDQMPPQMVTLEVQDVGRDLAAAPPPAPVMATRPWLFFDLDIDLPNRVFVRGRGVDSEWGGSFEITGHAGDPRVNGQIRPLRGGVSFLGKTFVLQEGSVSLSPDTEPLLDLTAVHETARLQAFVHVRGTASAPEFALTSSPPLPQEEIVSRVLFDKSSARLTAVEAVQLADAVAALAAGRTGGLLDTLREATGLDRLGFVAGAEEDDPGAVEVGTYLSRGVYVGVAQGTTGATTDVTVEVEVTPNITVKSDVGSDGRNRVGVRWRWDY